MFPLDIQFSLPLLEFLFFLFKLFYYFWELNGQLHLENE